MDAAAAGASPATTSFFPVHVDSINEDILAMDLYIRYGPGEMTLYRSQGVDFTDVERRRLRQQKVDFLYIPMSQHGVYREALGRRLETLFRSGGVTRTERARLVRASCVKMVEDVMLFPGNAGTVGAVQEVGQVFARLVEENEGEFSYLLDMSEHDYYTTTHMVNVGVGCGLLVKTLCQNDPQREQKIALAIQGGLLHDLGKRGVPEAVLNKEGKLSDEEWKMIQSHPGRGHEELAALPDVDPMILEMTRDHHERLDGTGYPNGIKQDEIGFGARVCAVVDVYDAITAARPYRGPIPPDEALQIMSKNVGTHFDPGIFAVWKAVVQRMLTEDPKRTSMRIGNGPRPKAKRPVRKTEPGIAASSASELPDRALISGTERRLHPRHTCDLPATAIFARQMKDVGIAPGETFHVRIRDLSRTGVLIQTPWPLSINDLLVLELKTEDNTMRRRVRVVRVRRGSDGSWSAGACFVAQEAEGKAA